MRATKAKRLFTGILSIILATTPTLSAYAIDGNADGSNNAGVVTGKGGDFSANINPGAGEFGKIGVRLSLVERNNPSQVISYKKVTDSSGNTSLKPMVWDLIYVDKPHFYHQMYGVPLGSELIPENEGKALYDTYAYDNYVYTSVKTQSLKNRTLEDNGNEIVWTYGPELNAYFPESNMPPWLRYGNNKYYSTGDDFVKWCKSDDAGNQVLGEGGELYTTNAFGGSMKLNKAEKRDGEIYVEYSQYLGDKAGQAIREDATDSEMEYQLEYWQEAISDPRPTQYYEDFRKLAPYKNAEKTVLDGFRYAVDQANGLVVLLNSLKVKYGKTEKVAQYEEAYKQLVGSPEFNLFFKNYAVFAMSSLVTSVNSPMKAAESAGRLAGSMSLSSMAERLMAIGVSSTDYISKLASGTVEEKVAILKDIKMKLSHYPADESGYVEIPGLGKFKKELVDYLVDTAGLVMGDDKAATAGGPPHIQRLLEMKDASTGEFYLQTQSMIEAHERGEELTLQSCKEDWILLVEPIVWLTIYPEGSTSRVIHDKVYGTITNITQAFVADPKLSPYLRKNTFNWKALNNPVWSALSVGEPGYQFNDPPNSLMLLAPTGISAGPSGYKSFETLAQELQVVPKVVTFKNGSGQEITQQMNTMAGWGVNVYWKGMLYDSKMSTWDKENHPEADPAPAPDPTNLDPESSWGEESKKFKISKWYTIEYRDREGNKNEEVIGVYTREDTPHTVKIENETGTIEEDNYMWEVRKWSTGKEDLTPDDNDLDTTFEEFYKKNKGDYQGMTPALLEMNPAEDKDKVLYVKLVATEMIDPLPENGDTINIIKVKEPDTGNTIIETTEIPKETPVYNATEDGWAYIEDTQTPEKPQTITKWDEVPAGTPGTNIQIPVSPDSNTIYIHYKGEPQSPPGKQPLILHENEISYKYSLRDFRSDKSLAGIKERFANKYRRTSEWCGGHGKHGTKKYSGTTYIEDSIYVLSVTSSNTAPNFIADYAEQAEGGNTAWYHLGYKGIRGGDTDTLTPNANFLVYRDKTKDLVTLYPNKNTGDYSRLGIANTSAIPTPRYKQEGTGRFYNTYRTNFAKAGNYDHTLSFGWNCRKDCYHGDTWDGSFVSGYDLSTLNSAYYFDNNIDTRYEVGTIGTGTAQPAKQRAADFSNVFYNNAFVDVQEDGKIEFYPYIKMKYNNKSNTATDVLVTSTNTSTISAITKIESGVWKNGAHDDETTQGTNPDPNVTLDSTQWSTHKNSLNFMTDNSVNDKKSVLPGGATFDVSMKVKANEWNGEATDTPTTSTKLGYRVWQTCIDDSRVGLMAPNNTAPTLNEAKQKVTELDADIKQNIPTYGLIQTIATGIVEYTGYLESFTNSEWSPVSSGDTWNSIALSTDAKYYLKLLENAGNGADSNTTTTNFDILKGGLVKQKLYTVASDTDGNVWVSLDGAELGKITATQTTEQLLSQSPDIKLLDESTKVVTNYIEAIDRNRGADRQGKPWYNEAFDGVNVLYSYLSYDIGFGNSVPDSPTAGGVGTTKRSAVLDTKLTGALANKSDLYNFASETQNEKVRSSMILTGQVGNLATPTGELGKLTLKNGGTIQVKLENMSVFAYSKMFYIPNANVTDLN